MESVGDFCTGTRVIMNCNNEHFGVLQLRWLKIISMGKATTSKGEKKGDLEVTQLAQLCVQNTRHKKYQWYKPSKGTCVTARQGFCRLFSKQKHS